MSLLPKSEYLALLSVNGISAVHPKEMARDYEKSSKDWYHLLANESDLHLLVCVPNVKWYSVCRCHLIADDNSTAHEHVHALIHFENGSTMLGFKKKLQRVGKRLHTKTTFKKILCLDHCVGVLRYITCKDGQKPLRRDGDGLRGTPHSHYDRRVYLESWLHGRGKICGPVRDQISALAAEGVADLSVYTSHLELHDHNSCRCQRGAVGIRKRQEANNKRKEFYKTEKGLAIRKSYKEKQMKKKELIKQVMELGINKKAELQRETILKLLDLL